MMPVNGRKFVRVVKYLLAGVTVFCVSWIACVNEWHAGVRWTSSRAQLGRAISTMRTIVAYSEGKQAEMDRPTPLTCDSLPVFPKINHINRSWPGEGRNALEWQHVAGTRVSLYAAYYDDRTAQRYVRILATFHGRNYSTEDALFCQTRSRNGNLIEDTVEVVAAKPLEIWWHKWDFTPSEVDTPLLLSCPLTEPLSGPSVVSVVTEPCDNPSNAFELKPIKDTNKRSRTFTICVKDMNFDKDISQSLVEWIETNKILGVDLIDMYVDEVTEKTKRVLLHYQDKGLVRLFHVPIKHKSGRSLWQRRRDHILTYNDCLYRNVKESEYIVPLDIDEVVLPKIANTWPELLNRFNNYGWNSSERSSIMIQNVFFFDFMQEVDKYSSNGRGVKSKIYIKRDDVRIKDNDTLEIDKIELIVDSNNLSNEVIDDSQDEEVLYDKYKSRCGTELPTPKLVKHIVSSAVISPIGFYSKSWMLTKKVLTAFNHYPLQSLGASGSVGWSAPFKEVQLNHYKESCNTTVVGECARYGRRARIDRAALRLRLQLTRALADAICTGINII
ncbi:unnamed protein product [Spodoptera littoralis]|uniref:Glycosyltransferase family 92 protein n=1 Tax=Spodoptera littoralis TaxID=7109 RepID=A0A9P0N380_SPOLI|nr:unnamed protein product [Spodoptera littoralis]CAH1638226.1 unnamed protein product [Spodoptera littoralis]